LEVGELYRRRWQIELFFKWIKQNLKIKAFYGTFKNAVLIQIWTALIAHLLLVWLKYKTKVGWGLLQLIRLAQTMLLEPMDNLCYSISVPDSGDLISRFLCLKLCLF
jgi:IS4 transposase